MTAALAGVSRCRASDPAAVPDPGRFLPVPRPDTSLTTLLEQRCYLEPDSTLNFSYGYPEGLNPDWIVGCQASPPDDFLHVAPGRYISVIRGYFQNLFHSANVNLTPTCSLAFVIAARALLRAGPGEVIMLSPTYDSYAHIVSSFGGTVVYARREADNSVGIEGLRDKCTGRTRAVILCCPDNPLGVVYRQDALEQVISFCKEMNLTLVVDYCLAEVSPFGVEVPIVSRLASSDGLSYLLLGDTGKILGLGGSKFGAISYSDDWTLPLEAAQASYFFQYSQYDLYLLATVLADPRFPGYLRTANTRIAQNYQYLRETLSGTFRVAGMDAGCFCLIDVGRLAPDDVTYSAMLLRDHAALVIPVSYFYPERPARASQVRVSLARSAADIGALVLAMNSSARTGASPRPAA